MKKPVFFWVLASAMAVAGWLPAQDIRDGRRSSNGGSFWEGPSNGGGVLRPWGGPTTGQNWWTPVPQSGTASPRIIYVPGHFEWYYGRRIWVPGHYVHVPIYTLESRLAR